MKKFLLVLVILGLIFTACTGDNEKKEKDNKQGTQDIAKDYLDAFINNDLEKMLTFKLDEEMKKQLTLEVLTTIREQVKEAYGSHEKELNSEVVSADPNTTVKLKHNFEKGAIIFSISFDKDENIIGFFMEPVKEDVEESINIPDTIKEVEYVFGKEGLELPAVLSLPKNKESYPLLILVHGSGPNDRDETIGPNKPFRDIAWGLAEQGIAVFRYDKRTNVHGDKINSDEFTIYDETIDDATLAYEFINNNNNINSSDIYILGHSLGGYAIPRIAEEVVDASGFIIAAGNVRPLEDLMVEQYEYVYGLDGEITEKEQQTIDAVKNFKIIIKSIDENKDYNNQQLMGTGKKYWLDLKNYKPNDLAKEIEKPLFVIQGDRDYQITLKDYNLWIESLENKNNVTFKLYEGVNHLLMKRDGKPNPDEYNIKGNVYQEIIDDIAKWIQDN